MTLYVVATPIGNLQDITFRAIETLKSVDLIAAEDTRRTGILLKHYGINTPQISYHEYNKVERTKYLIKLMKEGKKIALVSDSGTPGIQDPGFYLIREAIREGIEVIPIPGPTAFVCALLKSGFPMDRFCFEGFLPRRSGRRKKRLQKLVDEERTMIFYESPHRITKFLNDLYEVLGDREIVVVRELTKRFEEAIRGRVTELIKYFEEHKPRGELVVVVKGKEKD